MTTLLGQLQTLSGIVVQFPGKKTLSKEAKQAIQEAELDVAIDAAINEMHEIEQQYIKSAAKCYGMLSNKLAKEAKQYKADGDHVAAMAAQESAQQYKQIVQKIKRSEYVPSFSDADEVANIESE